MIRQSLRLAAGILVGTAVSAAELNDPTRPPAQFVATVPGGAPAAGAGLQSIVGSGQQRRALLDGGWRKLGDRIGDARIVRITDTEVFLKTAVGAIEKLRLYPDVEIKGSVRGGNAGRGG